MDYIEFIFRFFLFLIVQTNEIVVGQEHERNSYLNLMLSQNHTRLVVYEKEQNWWTYWQSAVFHHEKYLTICVPLSKMIPCQSGSNNLLSVESTVIKYVLSCTTRPKEMECGRNVGDEFNYTVLDYNSILFSSLFSSSHQKLLYETIRTFQIGNNSNNLPNIGNDSVVVIQAFKTRLKFMSSFQDATVCFPSKNSLYYRTFFYYAYTNDLFPTLTQRTTWTIAEELSAVSRLLKAACLPGVWSFLSQDDNKLKYKFKNLLALCPQCNSNCEYAGQFGAVKCLLEQKADAAFASWLPIAKAFYAGNYFDYFNATLKESYDEENSTDSENAKKKYALLLAGDPVFRYGRKRKRSAPVTLRLVDPNFHTHDFSAVERARWLLKPIGGIVGSVSYDTVKDHLMEWIKFSRDTFERVFDIKSPVYQLQPAHSTLPNYLFKHSLYNRVMGLEPGEGVLNEYYLVVTSKQMDECQTFFEERPMAISGRKIFTCVVEKDTEGILKYLQQNTSSFSVIDYDDAAKFIFNTSYKFRVIAVESLQNEDMVSAALIRRDSYYQNFEQLRGARSCHGHRLSEISYLGPVMFLAKKSVIRMAQCPEPSLAKSLNEFFGNGSCVPGILEQENEREWKDMGFNLRSLCSQCVGSCSGDETELFSSALGALRCLISRKGDVAFVPPNVIQKAKFSIHENVSSTDFEVLCARNRRIKLADFRQNCAIHTKLRRMVIIPNYYSTLVDKMATEVVETLQKLFNGSHPLYTTIRLLDLIYIFSPTADQLLNFPMSFDETKQRIYDQSNLNHFHRQCVAVQPVKHVEMC